MQNVTESAPLPAKQAGTFSEGPPIADSGPQVKPQSGAGGALTVILLAIGVFAVLAGIASYASLLNSTPYTAITEIFFLH